MQLAQLIIRSVQFLLNLIITALIGNAIAEAFHGNPSSVNWAMAAAVFCWVPILYGLVASFMESIAIPVALMALDGITFVLSFIASLVLSVKLGVHSCGNKVSRIASSYLRVCANSLQTYLHDNHLTNGSHNPGKRCHELQAATVFFWFLFISFAVSLVLTFLKNRGSVGGIRRGAPSMSQVA